jgi:hypothetical protein
MSASTAPTKLPPSRLTELVYCGALEEASSSSTPKVEDDIYALGILVLEVRGEVR